MTDRQPDVQRAEQGLAGLDEQDAAARAAALEAAAAALEAALADSAD